MDFGVTGLYTSYFHVGYLCGRFWPAESAYCGWRQEQMDTDYNSPVEKKGWCGTLLRWESCGHFSQGESARTLAWTGFYCFSWVLHQWRIYYLLIEVIVYILDIIKEITNAEGKGGELIMLCPWENSHRLWKLPWRQAANIYCFRPGQGSFSKSKP